MENIFEMPILEQMYYFRKEDIEQTIYESNEEIRTIEGNVCDLAEDLLNYFKTITSDEEALKVFQKKIQEYELTLSNEVDFWSKAYYMLGLNDMNKMKKELKECSRDVNKNTFLNYTEAELNEYLQDKIDLNSEAYKKYKAKVRMIAEKYPRVLEVHEDSTPIVLNQEEMTQLMELKELDARVRAEEVKTFFKAGINEILNF